MMLQSLIFVPLRDTQIAPSPLTPTSCIQCPSLLAQLTALHSAKFPNIPIIAWSVANFRAASRRSKSSFLCKIVGYAPCHSLLRSSFPYASLVRPVTFSAEIVPLCGRVAQNFRDRGLRPRSRKGSAQPTPSPSKAYGFRRRSRGRPAAQ
jgi:hypothetical protein